MKSKVFGTNENWTWQHCIQLQWQLRCELLCAWITSCGSTCIVAIVKTAAFFRDFAKLLGYMSLFLSPFYHWYLNIRYNWPTDPATIRAVELLSSFGVTQCITQPMYDCGGILDIITSDDCVLSPVNISDVGLSDRHLICWPNNLQLSWKPIYEEKMRHLWQQFNLGSFWTALSSSSLCDAQSQCQVQHSSLAETYDATTVKTLDVHTPNTTIRCRVQCRNDL